MYRLIFRINCSRFFFMKVHPYQTANCVLCDVIPLMIIAKNLFAINFISSFEYLS